MVNYKEWKTKDLSVTNLWLDPLNPRIAEADESLSQRKLIEYLVEYDKVYELAKDIVEKGYFPTEALVGVENGNKKIIVEGNRRLAALKLLINPDTAPTAYRKKFRTLAGRVDITLLKKVKVVLAPSREAAAPMILAKHTATQVQGWSPIMQAKFYKQLMDDGLSVRQLSARYSITASQIRNFLQLDALYGIACSLNLPKDINSLVHNSRDFPASTLYRIMSSAAAQKFLGFEFDEDNFLAGKVNPDEFKKGYTKIVTDVASGEIHSRNLNKADEIKDYLDSFDDQVKPNLRRKGTFSYASLTGDVEPKKVRATETAKKTARSPRASASVVPPGTKCSVKDRRVNNIFDELRKLKLATHLNSSGIMLRVLLEMSVGYYLEKTNLMEGLLAKHRTGKHRKKNDWAPTLRQMLGHLANQETSVGLSPLTVKAVNKLLQDDNILSTDTFDAYVHNRRYNPTEEQLRSLWDALSEVFELTLVEPQEVTNAKNN